MIKFPTANDLSPMLADVTAQQTDAQYTSTQLRTITDILKSDPRQYRSYGVFWWPIKDLMIKNGITDFGLQVDKDILVLTEHLTPAEKLIAGYCNKIVALDGGHLYSSSHIYDAINSETEDYELSDLFVERLITNQL